MKFIFQLLAIVVLFTACPAEDEFKITGSGDNTIEERTLASFTTIISPSSLDINVVFGDTQKVIVAADNNIIDKVMTKVTGVALEVYLAPGSYNNINVTIEITIPEVHIVKSTGSGNISITGFNDLSTIALDNEGSGNITLSGETLVFLINNTGSGDIKAFDFIAEIVNINNSGSGKIEVRCNSELKGTNSGSGDVSYKGMPTLTITSTGSGQIVDAN